MQLPLLAMALMRLMVVPIMGGWASIVEPTMIVQLIGMVVPATPMARGAARQPGTMVRAAPQVGAGVPLPGIMDREVSAVSEAARPRGVAAPGARPDGEAARSPGAAVVFTVADSGDDWRTAAAWPTNGAWQLDRTLAAISVLPSIVDAVAGAVEVYVDGGIRRGTDVLKALGP